MDAAKLKEVLEYLAIMGEAEAAVAEFYGACAEAWPAEPMWSALQGYELGHSAAVNRMKELVAADPGAYQPGRPLNVKGVGLFVKIAMASTGKVRDRVFTHKQALVAARDIELSIIEARYDQLLATKNKEFLALVGQLMTETKGHRDAVNKRLAESGLIK